MGRPENWVLYQCGIYTTTNSLVVKNQWPSSRDFGRVWEVYQGMKIPPDPSILFYHSAFKSLKRKNRKKKLAQTYATLLKWMSKLWCWVEDIRHEAIDCTRQDFQKHAEAVPGQMLCVLIVFPRLWNCISV